MEIPDFLKKVEKINSEKFRNLTESKESFVLYVRSEELFERIKEMFDVDVVFPELSKAFPNVPFYWTDVKEISINVKPPAVIIFKEGEVKEVLSGIRTWAEYISKIRENLSC